MLAQHGLALEKQRPWLRVDKVATGKSLWWRPSHLQRSWGVPCSQVADRSPGTRKPCRHTPNAGGWTWLQPAHASSPAMKPKVWAYSWFQKTPQVWGASGWCVTAVIRKQEELHLLNKHSLKRLTLSQLPSNYLNTAAGLTRCWNYELLNPCDNNDCW